MSDRLKRLHLFGTWKKICLFSINNIFVGTGRLNVAIKRELLGTINCKVGKGTTIVGPIYPKGTAEIGCNCWIGAGLRIEGNGHVIIGNNCDFAPEVVFITGGHEIGDATRRAGKGEKYLITIGDGTWCGCRATIGKNIKIGNSCVIAACACVMKDVLDNSVVGGVPAREIRRMSDET